MTNFFNFRKNRSSENSQSNNPQNTKAMTNFFNNRSNETVNNNNSNNPQNSKAMTNFFNFRNPFNSSYTNNQVTTPPISSPEQAVQSSIIHRDHDFTHQDVTRVKLSEHAFNIASKTLGDPAVLEATLEEVLHGKIIDIEESHIDREKIKNALNDQLAQEEARMIEPEKKIEYKQEVELADRDRRISEVRGKIRDIREKGIDDELEPYSPLIGWITGIGVVIAAIASYVFYNSAVYSAYFRDMDKEMSGQEVDMNSLTSVVFNPNALTSGNVGSYIIPFIILIFGICLFAIRKANKWKSNAQYKMIFVVALMADLFLAYKIHEQSIDIQNLNIISGEPKEATILSAITDPNFWGVVVMGFLAIVATSVVLEQHIKEKEKKHQPKRLAQRIRLHEEDIEMLQQEKIRLQEEIMRLKTELETIKTKVKSLREMIARVETGITDMRKSINVVYKNWIMYVASSPKADELRASCMQVFEQFKEKHKEVLEAYAIKTPSGSRFNMNPFVTLMAIIGMALAAFVFSSPAQAQPVNKMVILDLSDRILEAGQVEDDQEMIMQAWAEYEQAIKREKAIMLAKSIFQIVVIPQQGQSDQVRTVVKKLTLDLNSMPIAEKSKRIVAFRKSLPQMLSDLYRVAWMGNKSSNYPGADTWGFFNQYINDYYKASHQNQCLVLTDGYLDFEKKDREFGNASNQFTTTHFMRTDPDFQKADWQTRAERRKLGIMPVKLKPGFQFQIRGLRAKKSESHIPFRINQLKYLWNKWIKMSQT